MATKSVPKIEVVLVRILPDRLPKAEELLPPKEAPHGVALVVLDKNDEDEQDGDNKEQYH
jgi:hypothetical protein